VAETTLETPAELGRRARATVEDAVAAVRGLQMDLEATWARAAAGDPDSGPLAAATTRLAGLLGDAERALGLATGAAADLAGWTS
jgi:hypothetical protein